MTNVCPGSGNRKVAIRNRFGVKIHLKFGDYYKITSLLFSQIVGRF